jgi:hypothetical protein
LNIHPFNCTFISGDRMTFGRKWPELASFCIQKVSCAWGPNSADRKQILLQSASMFKSLVKMHQYLLYNRPRMLTF